MRVANKQTGGGAQPGGGTSFELVLCDVELPGIPGVEVLNQLRAQLRSEVSIIMLASDMEGAQAEMVERCIVEGADSYIVKPAALKELTALWGFVARRRQHKLEQGNQMADLNQVIRSVEEELGTAPSKQSLGGGGGSGGSGGGGGGSGGAKELAVRGGAANVAAQAFAEVGTRKRRVRWSMHAQFEEDLKADLAEAQKRDLPASSFSFSGRSSALINPKLEKGVQEAVSSLMELLQPGSGSLLPGSKGGKEGGKLQPKKRSKLRRTRRRLT